MASLEMCKMYYYQTKVKYSSRAESIKYSSTMRSQVECLQRVMHLEWQ